MSKSGFSITKEEAKIYREFHTLEYKIHPIFIGQTLPLAIADLKTAP
jgi:hypothetical protein